MAAVFDRPFDVAKEIERLRNLAHEVHELGHLGGDADHAVITGSAAHLTAQSLDFGAQGGGFERILDGDVKFIEIDWRHGRPIDATPRYGVGYPSQNR